MSDLYSFLRSILRLFFLIFSFLPLALGYRVLTKEMNQFELTQLADMATVYGASGIAMLVILYILEIEKKK